MKKLFKQSLKIWDKPPLTLLAVATVVGASLIAAGIAVNQADNSTQNQNNLAQTDKLIAKARERLNNDNVNPERYADLCQLYLQKIRETADTSLYAKCDQLLAKASKLSSNNPNVLAAQSAVAYAKHDFNKGLNLAKKASSINPDKVAYYGLVGDGQIELGQYNSATASYQTMVDLKPELSAYNRVAYVRELYGDIAGAKTALSRAISSGSAFRENVAYSQVELGKLYMRSDLNKAEETYAQALQTYSDYPPALEALGKVAFARQDYKNAVNYFQRAFTVVPLAQYAASLGDVYTAQNDKNKADSQYYLASLAFDNSDSGGVNNDYERALYLSQRGLDSSKSLELARKSIIDRPNIFSFDALAWALYRAGKFKQAEANINHALRLGEHEPVILYHAGLIAEKLGRQQQARAYLKKAFSQDKYFLESHFTILDRQEGLQALQRLR